MGAATTVIMLPEEKLGIIILTNTAPFGVPEALALSFIELVTHDNVDKNVFEQKFDFGKREFEKMRRADLSKTDYTTASRKGFARPGPGQLCGNVCQ